MNDQSSLHYAIVLAAGFSARMGTCKADLPWLSGQTLLSYQISQLQQAEITPIVVLGAHNTHSQRQCPSNSVVVFNPQPQNGKAQSVCLGLSKLPEEFETVTVSAVDQPRSAAIYQQLLSAHLHHKALITVPIYRQKRGHPLVFSASLLPQLKAIQDATQGLRAVVQNYSAQLHPVAIDSAMVLADLNTPELYEAALKQQIGQ